ncbi:hypothetical protein BP6252_06478 [Coleophoma cylindrospora]|uniref:2EXR domain-containing protein n=1 Tax=Coleophoma cylindrospora TaxID=1849047 RepID=A0A3D8RN21_9HELO|nr:hypothetical protein BP6252_06478 [Coleophoma cylindrospora]
MDAGTSAPASPNRTSFPFQELPRELQDRIWELAATPRIVKFRWSNATVEGRAGAWLVETPNPAILHICHAARTIALKSYILLDGPPAITRDVRRIDAYWNPEIDVVLFSPITAKKCPVDRTLVKRMLVPRSTMTCVPVLREYLPRLEQLEEIYFQVQEGDADPRQHWLEKCDVPGGCSLKTIWGIFSALRSDIQILEGCSETSASPPQKQRALKVMVVRQAVDVLQGRLTRHTDKTFLSTNSPYVLDTQGTNSQYFSICRTSRLDGVE